MTLNTSIVHLKSILCRNITASLISLPLLAGAMNPAMALDISPAGKDAAPALDGDGASPDAAYESARNQFGVLAYCQQKGAVSAQAVATQVRLLAMLPPGDIAKGDAAEMLGKNGIVSGMEGEERSLADAAIAQETTEESLCEKMEILLVELVARIPS
ncbi:pore-forming ESAT-6 family protein [Paracoccus litorisediminis]|uniref:pore-forming ESAT-6 family protein n=1 Tax=Paracoccus litorisediminis TaxID=2006130 RepID=UPI003730045C